MVQCSWPGRKRCIFVCDGVITANPFGFVKTILCFISIKLLLHLYACIVVMGLDNILDVFSLVPDYAPETCTAITACVQLLIYSTLRNSTRSQSDRMTISSVPNEDTLPVVLLSNSENSEILHGSEKTNWLSCDHMTLHRGRSLRVVANQRQAESLILDQSQINRHKHSNPSPVISM